MARDESWPGVPRLSQNASYGWGAWCYSKTFLSFINRQWLYNIQLKTSRGLLFLPSSDAHVRSFLYLLYTLIKLYYTKALSDQASSLAPDWILLLRRPRIPASFRSATTFHWCKTHANHFVTFSSAAQSCLTLCDPMQARLPCPSPTPGVYSNSCPLSRWCHPTISSCVVHFSSCLQSFPASGSFLMSQLFASGGQSIGVSASPWVILINIQDFFTLR